MSNIDHRKVMEAGQNALTALRSVEKALDTAKKLGIVDIVSTSTIFATLKRGRGNKARESVALAKTELQSFENELKALGDAGNIDLDADDFLEAADAFVGEDPFNAVSQNRLKQIKEAVQQAIGGVESMLEKL